jgi:hypothetical protein
MPPQTEVVAPLRNGLPAVGRPSRSRIVSVYTVDHLRYDLGVQVAPKLGPHAAGMHSRGAHTVLGSGAGASREISGWITSRGLNKKWTSQPVVRERCQRRSIFKIAMLTETAPIRPAEI